MTSEVKTLIHLYDILAIQLQCNTCGTSISRRISEADKAMLSCPSCRTFWMQTDTNEEKRVRMLPIIIGEAMQALEGRAFSLMLEIKQSVPQK